VHARERDGHERVPERPDVYRSRLHLPFAAGDQEAPRGRAERHDPLAALAFLAAPEEEPRRSDVDPAEAPDLDLD
jgi:hypothetical protein